MILGSCVTLLMPCHAYAKIQDGGMLKISQKIIKLCKMGKGDLHIILKVLPNEIIIIKKMLPCPFNVDK